MNMFYQYGGRSYNQCIDCKQKCNKIYNSRPEIKEINAERNRLWNLAHPGVRAARTKKHNLTPLYRYKRGLATAKKRNKTFTISLEEYLTLCDKPCFYCKNKLGEQVKICLGLDRLDNSVGYELHNVVPCCEICNKLRGDYLTPEETSAAVEAILFIRGRPKPNHNDEDDCANQ